MKRKTKISSLDLIAQDRDLQPTSSSSNGARAHNINRNNGSSVFDRLDVDSDDELDLLNEEQAAEGTEAEDSQAPDDTLGLYLRQMGAIPLLTRKEELDLAQRLEVARLRYRRSVLLNWRILAHVVELFERVQAGKLPLD